MVSFVVFLVCRGECFYRVESGTESREAKAIARAQKGVARVTSGAAPPGGSRLSCGLWRRVRVVLGESDM